MSPWTYLGVLLLGAFFGWAVGYHHGWTMGEKDTERRWSEAVGRAQDRGPR